MSAPTKGERAFAVVVMWIMYGVTMMTLWDIPPHTGDGRSAFIVSGAVCTALIVGFTVAMILYREGKLD